MTLHHPTNATSIEVDTDVPLVRITRDFNSPPETVFRAHGDPDLFVRWNGPTYRYMVNIGGYELY